VADVRGSIEEEDWRRGGERSGIGFLEDGKRRGDGC
jgi:hypothetical protein